MNLTTIFQVVHIKTKESYKILLSMDYRINGDVIYSKKWKVHFPFFVKKLECFKKANILVVLFEKESQNNVWGIDTETGETIWKIEDFEIIDHPYVDIYRVNDTRIRLFSWDGFKVEISPIDGKLIDEILANGNRPW